ncbi:M4 family metallopeptidase [Thermomonas sp.]|jgi:Zn-dependent metalloprotease|uniref:M4 family metallopeptidase n=1 Tax=Thermomonas sp. TaxID=1971895 RepID=UPI0025801BF0|nr:M4 family metallopeptidase [Thermomonas sp.]
MKFQASLLCLAIASVIAPATADAATSAKSAVVARANALIGNQAAAMRKNPLDAFVASDASVDANGTEHVRYQRSWRGMPVIGGDFVVHSRSGKLAGVSQTLATAARPSLAARVNGDQAIVEAGAAFPVRFTQAPTSRKVVYARNVAPVLAHEVVFHGFKADQTPTEMHYIVDASSGKIIDQWDGIHTARPGAGGSGCTSPAAATGTGKTLMAGDVVLDTSKCGTSYQMVDVSRGGGATHNMAMKTSGMGTVFTGSTNVWGNNLLSNSQTVAADAHYGVATTWDYFKNVHGRNGIANDGKGAVSRVHYGRNYQNAFWSDSCFCMTFGDGDNGASIYPLVAIDVAGHEMSHGVTSRSANLVYSKESGGLNEATSDIFGTMVEYYANNSSDPADYVVGEELFPNNASMRNAIRWMFKPSLDGASPDCYSSTLGNLDVHYSSGVANHFYYLLAEGAVVPSGFGAGTWANLTPASLVCNGNTSLAGIGRDAAGKIWYRALTVYMTSSTNYAAARTASINASTDLFGATSAQTNAVKAAWSAVSVN